MSTAYETFLPYVYPLVPNVPEPSAIYAVRNACIDFCRGSLFLQQEIDPITVVAGTAEYEIDTPTGTVLTQVLTLYHSGLRLSKRSLSEITATYTRDWRSMTGTPKMWTQFNPNEVTLILTPDTTLANALTGTMAVVPARTSLSVDSNVFERYVETIARGAAAKLMAIPNEPFTSPDGALLYTRLFNSDVSNARAAVNAGQTRAPLKVRFQRG